MFSTTCSVVRPQASPSPFLFKQKRRNSAAPAFSIGLKEIFYKSIYIRKLH